MNETKQKPQRFSSCAKGYQELVHAYAYAPLSESGRTSCDRMSYEGGRVYSYSTCIAFKAYPEQLNEPVLFITTNRHSNTTAKQKRLLEQATSHWTHIYINTHSGYNSVWPNDILMSADDYINEMRALVDNNKLTNKKNVEAFMHAYTQLNKIATYWVASNRVINDFLLEMLPVVEKLEAGDLAEWKTQARKQAKEEREKLTALVSDFRSKNGHSQCAQFVFTAYKHTSEEREIASALKKLLTRNGEYTVIWFENDLCETSQGVTIPKNIAAALLRRWKAGELNQGDKILDDRYTIIKSTKDGAKIGCHSISAENAEALLSEIE